MSKIRKSLSLVFLHYLRLLAIVQLSKVKLIQRLKNQPLTIIGITGSAGKSSVLLALDAALKPNFKVKTNYGGNSESGIPLNILDIPITNFTPKDWLVIAFIAPFKLLINWRTYQIYLVEMGIDAPTEPKNMSYLLKIIQPQIGIFLNAGAVHSENFDNLLPPTQTGSHRLEAAITEIAKEKARLINTLPSSGFAILNLEDKNVQKTTQITSAHKLTIAHTASTFKIIKSHSGPDGFRLKFTYQSKEYDLCFDNLILPQIYEISFAAAFLAARTLDLTPETIITNLEANFHNPPSRSSLFKGIHNSLIIDSSYNSSPQPTAEMLKLLSTFPSPRIAVLGDMRELGEQSSLAHQELFKVAQKSADLVIGIGPETKKYFVSTGASSCALGLFQFYWQAQDFLIDYLSKNPHSTLLFKGSQNTIFLEELIKPLLSDPKDTAKLCRQTPYWLGVKSKFRRQTK